MDTIKERLIQFAKSQGLMMMDFYKKISVAHSNFSGDGANSALSTDKIVHILTTYPELSADWLLLGKGEILRKNNPKTDKLQEKEQASVENHGFYVNDRAGNNTYNNHAELMNLVTSQQKTIQDLTTTIKILTTKQKSYSGIDIPMAAEDEA